MQTLFFPDGPTEVYMRAARTSRSSEPTGISNSQDQCQPYRYSSLPNAGLSFLPTYTYKNQRSKNLRIQRRLVRQDLQLLEALLPFPRRFRNRRRPYSECYSRSDERKVVQKSERVFQMSCVTYLLSVVLFGRSAVHCLWNATQPHPT